MSNGLVLKLQLFAKARELAGGKSELEIRLVNLSISIPSRFNH